MIADFNTSYWPITHVKFNSNELNDESFEEYKKYYLTLLVKCKKENEKMYVIFDLNSAKDLPMNYIMKQIQFNKEIEKFNKEYVKLASIMCKNKAFKNILNLYFSMSNKGAPFKIFRSFEKMNLYFDENFKIKFDFNLFEDKNSNLELNNGSEIDEEEEDDKSESINNMIK
jgi:hypothetical protein